MGDILKTGSVLLVTCMFLLYVNQVVRQYAEGLTTFALNQADTGTVPMPAMTACFENPLKPSLLIAYNTSPVFFEVPTQQSSGIPMNQSVKDIYEKASYLLGRDWNISINEYPSDKYLTLTTGLNNLAYSKNRSLPLEVIEMKTMSKGTCLVVVPRAEIEALTVFAFTFAFDENLNGDLPESVKIYLTPPEAYLGYAIGAMLDYNPYKNTIPLGKFETVALKLTEWFYYPGKGLCQNYPGSDSVYECIARKAWAKMKLLDPKACALTTHQSFFGLGVDFCKTRSDEDQNYDIQRKGMEEGMKACKIPCFKAEYDGDVLESQKMENTSRVELYIMMGTSTKKINIEHLVYDSLGMLGSLGGSLALFVGGSLLDFLLAIIDIVRRKRILKLSRINKN